jgi:hypothetical protein
MSVTYELGDEALRLHALDEAFRNALPPELVPFLDHWRRTARP